MRCSESNAHLPHTLIVLVAVSLPNVLLVSHVQSPIKTLKTAGLKLLGSSVIVGGNRFMLVIFSALKLSTTAPSISPKILGKKTSGARSIRLIGSMKNAASISLVVAAIFVGLRYKRSPCANHALSGVGNARDWVKELAEFAMSHDNVIILVSVGEIQKSAPIL